MNRALTIEHQQTEGEHRLIARGELDLATAQTLHEAIEEATSGGAVALEIDISRLRFLDGAGIAALAHAVARCTARGIPVMLAPPNARSPQRLLRMTGMDRELPWLEQGVAAGAAT